MYAYIFSTSFYHYVAISFGMRVSSDCEDEAEHSDCFNEEHAYDENYCYDYTSFNVSYNKLIQNTDEHQKSYITPSIYL